MRKILLFATILFLLFFLRYQTKLINSIGEFFFLDLHFPNVAERILTNSVQKNYYTYYLLGRINFVQNDLTESIAYFNKTINENPTFKEGYYGRGLAYGFYSPIFLPDAAVDFQKYIDIDEEEFSKDGYHAYGAWAAYNDLAWIFFLQGEFIKAEETARKGLKISGTNPWLFNMLAVSLIEQSRCNEAKLYLELADKSASSISVKEFGEAYSGDSPIFWEKGRESMLKTIKDNIKLCQTFPQN